MAESMVPATTRLNLLLARPDVAQVDRLAIAAGAERLLQIDVQVPARA
jgi:hypothetical protein